MRALIEIKNKSTESVKLRNCDVLSIQKRLRSCERIADLNYLVIEIFTQSPYNHEQKRLHTILTTRLLRSSSSDSARSQVVRS